tara:strand:+ start:293 stop:1651 length:1359 start_codon:yes stop_codon:yes gene_type:complete
MKIFFTTLLLLFLNYKSFADNSPLGSIKSGIHKVTPFHLIKNTAEKISSFGLDKIFWGVASLFIITEAYEAGIFDEKSISKKAINNKPQFKKILSKGQIHTNGIDEVEARRRALDDALYFASVKGGVQVHGFSTIDNQTNITENFTVKPQSKIIDYKILKSFKKDDIYIVEIEAIVGNISKESTCGLRKSLNIKEFKGIKVINTNLPQKIDKYIHILSDKISFNLKNDKIINYTDNKSKYYDFNLEGFDKSFDYLSLVNGTSKVSHGDFIYIPTIKFFKTKIYPSTFLIEDGKYPKIESYKILDTDAIRVEFSIDIFNGITNTLVENIQEKYLIPINTDSNFEIIELFTKADREFINQEFMNIAIDVTESIKAKLLCQPVSARLQLVNSKLQVPLGTNHGLRKNQLAVIESDTNNWTMLSISNINFSNSILMPLNSSVEIKELLGKKTRFLE